MADAPYRDIFKYIGGTGATPDFKTTSGKGVVEGPSDFIQSLIDKGVITQSTRHYTNESGEGDISSYNVDTSKLPALKPPTTNLPGGMWWIPAYDKADLINPNLTYTDPNYGLMTTSSNLKSNKGDWQDFIGPVVMSLVTLGAGSLPAFGQAGAAALSSSIAAGTATTSLPWWSPLVNTGIKTAGSLLLGKDTYPIPSGTPSSVALPGDIGAAIGGTNVDRYANDLNMKSQGLSAAFSSDGKRMLPSSFSSGSKILDPSFFAALL